MSVAPLFGRRFLDPRSKDRHGAAPLRTVPRALPASSEASNSHQMLHQIRPFLLPAIALPPRACERWPVIVSGSWRGRSNHITPEMPMEWGSLPVPRYEWRRQGTRRDITTQSQSCVGPMMHVNHGGGCELLGTGAVHQRFIATIWSSERNPRPTPKMEGVHADVLSRTAGWLRFHTGVRRCRS